MTVLLLLPRRSNRCHLPTTPTLLTALSAPASSPAQEDDQEQVSAAAKAGSVGVPAMWTRLSRAGSESTDGAQPETISVIGHYNARDGLVPKQSNAAAKTSTPLIEMRTSVIGGASGADGPAECLHHCGGAAYTSGVLAEAQNGFTRRHNLLSIRGFISNNDGELDGLKLFNGTCCANQHIDSFLLCRYGAPKEPPSVLYDQSDLSRRARCEIDVNASRRLQIGSILHRHDVVSGIEQNSLHRRPKSGNERGASLFRRGSNFGHALQQKKPVTGVGFRETSAMPCRAKAGRWRALTSSTACLTAGLGAARRDRPIQYTT